MLVGLLRLHMHWPSEGVVASQVLQQNLLVEQLASQEAWVKVIALFPRSEAEGK